VAEDVKKLPGDVSHLQRLIGDHAADRKMPPARLQRWLNAMIVTAVLDRVRDEDGEPIFLLKGSVAMELRLQLRARATGDYDAAFRTRTEEVIDRLDEALAQPWNSFNLTRDARPVCHRTGRHAAPFRSPSMAASNDVGSLGENPLIASPLAPIRNDGVPVSPAFSAARASPAISLASSGSRRSLAQRARSRPVTWLALSWRYASVT
jgi:hypothetical protein